MEYFEIIVICGMKYAFSCISMLLRLPSSIIATWIYDFKRNHVIQMFYACAFHLQSNYFTEG
jgi:uncharacterized membrane protein